MEDITERFDPSRPVSLQLASGEWTPARLHYWHRGASGRYVGGVTFLSAGWDRW